MSAPASAPATRRGGDRHTGRGLVVRRSVEVDAGLGAERRGAARVELMTVGVAQVRGGLGGRGELRAELAEASGTARGPDEAERRRVPERRGPAEAEDRPRSRRAARTGRPARSAPGRPGPHGLLPVRGAQDRGGRRRAAPSTCSTRTFEGPQPKRPSAGSRSAGIVMVVGSMVVVTGTSFGRRDGAARSSWLSGLRRGCARSWAAAHRRRGTASRRPSRGPPADAAGASPM